MRFLRRFLNGFQRLQWKLMVSYTLITTIVLFLLEIVFISVIFYLNFANFYPIMSSWVRTTTWTITNDLADGAIERGDIQSYLDRVKDGPYFDGFIVLLDPQKQVIATTGNQEPSDAELSSKLPGEIQEQLQALSRNPSAIKNGSTEIHKGGVLYIVAPISSKGELWGMLLVKAGNFRLNVEGVSQFTSIFLIYFGISIFIFFIGAGIIGLAFGLVTARSFVLRLKRIATSVDRWSQGDFSLFVRDRSGDELGQLARQLNRMAEQLQLLLRTRQDLAMLEERNRLARDLHDSVKQQVFAVSMQISTTRSLMASNSEAAHIHLGEAERLVRQAQQELTGLIRELRPVALADKGLTNALQDYLQSWQVQTGIVARLEIDGTQAVPLAIEDTLFRITQEALANVARHSQASSVHIHLIHNDSISLTITDDGCGFRLQEQTHHGVGLTSMRERVEAMHGDITIQSEKGKGTVICVQYEQQKNHKVVDS